MEHQLPQGKDSTEGPESTVKEGITMNQDAFDYLEDQAKKYVDARGCSAGDAGIHYPHYHINPGTAIVTVDFSTPSFVMPTDPLLELEEMRSRNRAIMLGGPVKMFGQVFVYKSPDGHHQLLGFFATKDTHIVRVVNLEAPDTNWLIGAAKAPAGTSPFTMEISGYKSWEDISPLTGLPWEESEKVPLPEALSYLTTTQKEQRH